MIKLKVQRPNVIVAFTPRPPALHFSAEMAQRLRSAVLNRIKVVRPPVIYFGGDQDS